MFYDWKPYVSVADRRRQAKKEMDALRRKGHAASPVVIEGRNIARTFWGRAWCENLESYSDFSNRLPRGRTYVRNGSVVDLQIAEGVVEARVSGSALYTVSLKIKPLPAARWKEICRECSGGIDSLVELLQGRFSEGVMERLCRQKTGLFPAPAEISLSCSCPDWASMCKHVAAVLYGVGARLDEKPELLFRLRAVDEKELVAHAGAEVPLARSGPAAESVLGGEEDLSALFGVDLGDGAPAEVPAPAKKKRATAKTGAKRKTKRKTAAKAGGAKKQSRATPGARAGLSAKKPEGRKTRKAKR